MRITDLINEIETRLKSYGYDNDIQKHYHNQLDEYAQDLFLRFIIYKSRIISARKRKVYYSKLLCNKSPELLKKIKKLQEIFEKGGVSSPI